MESGEDRALDGRALRYQHRRPELLQAIVEYVLANGIADLSLRPMAAELGIGHATLLRHFQTKEALITEVLLQIRSELGETMRRMSDGMAKAPTIPALRAVWHELCQPPQRRQFLLLFEVAAMQGREPGRFGDLAEMLIAAFIEPVEQNLLRQGATVAAAKSLATGYVAMLRGLQLDLALSDDLPRVDAAMMRHIDLIADSLRR